MSSAIASVILASAQSVGKVYMIGAVGFLSVKYPRNNVLLPADSIVPMARFSFNVLTLCLIYSTIARTTSIATIGSYWFEMVGNVAVVGISYVTATVLGFFIHIQNPLDFDALRIAASFPNIVALPILIFPALCEYTVVHQAFGGSYTECVNESTSKIFAYFFSWSLLFWTFGQSKLLASANQRAMDSMTSDNVPITAQEQPSTSDMALTTEPSTDADGTLGAQPRSLPNDEGLRFSSNNNMTTTPMPQHEIWMTRTRKALAQIFLSPGFLAMIFGFITGCIPILQQALFSQAGALRFLGGAIDTMGTASTSISTIVVAASLVPHKNPTLVNDAPAAGSEDGDGATSESRSRIISNIESHCDRPRPTNEPSIAIISDPNFGPGQERRRSIGNVMMVVRRRSSRFRDIIRRSDRDMMRLHVWFFLSRLVLTPAIVSGTVVALECTGVLTSVSNLSKLVLIINSALPGALIVVVLLKSQAVLSESAAVVAKVYLSSYLLSIVPIAAWTSVGLYITVPHEDGTSFCGK